MIDQRKQALFRSFVMLEITAIFGNDPNNPLEEATIKTVADDIVELAEFGGMLNHQQPSDPQKTDVEADHGR